MEDNLTHLNELHPTLRPYVKAVLNNEFGLLKSSPRIHGIQCGDIPTKGSKQYGDRFQLTIFYCQRQLNWTILMNGNDITIPPDVILEENYLAISNLENKDTIKKKVPSLVNWKPKDVKCLLNVILELLQLFANYQIDLLRSNSGLQRYSFEYDYLLSKANIMPFDVEVCVLPTPRTMTVIFAIHLFLDFSKLPAALPDCKNFLVLVVEFKDNSKNNIQLLPRFEVNEYFDGIVKLPALLNIISLNDYVSQVECILQKRIDNVVSLLNERKLLYSYLVQFFEPALISGDDINFTSVSFLLELLQTFYILKVHISVRYPERKPELQLLPFKMQKNSDNKFSFHNYSYNPKMSHEEVARAIFNYVVENMSKLS